MAKRKTSPYVIGKLYTLIDVDESVKEIRGRLEEIDPEGYYIFIITTRKCDTEEFWTKVPEQNVKIK